jgi:uncharacterized damage-inducible protein DinB
MTEEAARLPYVHLLEGRDAAEVLRSTPEQLHQLLTPLSVAAIETAPAPGKWSVREQMCHLADCEVAWAWRLRHTFGEDNPLHASFEQDAWARAYNGKGYTFTAAWDTWRALRGWNLALIDVLSPEDRKRLATHPSAGPVTLWDLVEIAAGHDLHHLATFDRSLPGRPS